MASRSEKQQSHDADTPVHAPRTPANRLGLDYRTVPPSKLAVPIVDVHTHVHNAKTAALFFEAAALYGVRHIVSMTPLDELPALRAAHAADLEFIAIPRWRSMSHSADFQRQWLADLAAFRDLGSRRMKFWMAPPMRGTHGLTLAHPFIQPVIEEALRLGYDFMVHIADPSEWFEPGRPYADTARFGTKRDQYPQLEHLLDRVAPRTVIAAHMGGYVEDPAFLQNLLDRHANLHLDSSATKWVVRGVARQSEALREFMLRNADRVLFGSDLVVADAYDFDHYASRYWTHRMLWETAYRGESPIEDPDAGDPPQLVGLDLPADVLRKLYIENARRLGHGGSASSELRPTAAMQARSGPHSSRSGRDWQS